MYIYIYILAYMYVYKHIIMSICIHTGYCLLHDAILFSGALSALALAGGLLQLVLSLNQSSAGQTRRLHITLPWGQGSGATCAKD